MAHEGKARLNYVIIAPADQMEEGDRIFRSHRRCMESTHHRDRERALPSYEVSNPMDTSSAPAGNMGYVLLVAG